MNIDKHIPSSSELTPTELSDSLAASSNNLERIANEIHDLADRDRTDPIALLQLLRTLEHLHREIQQDYFQSALPNSRQALYTLLRDIEENGGWPYIQRWKLQALFANLAETEK
jgi:ABC-type transporter Mla subunit MlaD